LSPNGLTKLDVLETIHSSPKTNLLMTICLSQISLERARRTVTSATPPFSIRNQYSRFTLHFKAHFAKQGHNSPRNSTFLEYTSTDYCEPPTKNRSVVAMTEHQAVSKQSCDRKTAAKRSALLICTF